MDSKFRSIIQSYEKLLLIHRRQIELCSEPRSEKQFEQLQQLEEQKKDHIILINQHRLNTNDYMDIVSSESRDFIINCTNEMLLLNNELNNRISEWYTEDSKAMKKVSIHRKTLQTYGGIHNNDVISYYFDEKK